MSRTRTLPGGEVTLSAARESFYAAQQALHRCSVEHAREVDLDLLCRPTDLLDRETRQRFAAEGIFFIGQLLIDPEQPFDMWAAQIVGKDFVDQYIFGGFVCKARLALAEQLSVSTERTLAPAEMAQLKRALIARGLIREANTGSIVKVPCIDCGQPIEVKVSDAVPFCTTCLSKNGAVKGSPRNARDRLPPRFTHRQPLGAASRSYHGSGVREDV